MRIMLIGFQNAGKTTVGRRLAKRIGFNFVDTDLQLTQRYGLSARDLYLQMGEANFRNMEKGIIEEACAHFGSSIIALGGGSLISLGCVNNSIKKITSDALIIYLAATFETILQRYQTKHCFPAFAKNEEVLHAIYSKRLRGYENVCDMKISTDNKSCNVIVEEIINRLECCDNDVVAAIHSSVENDINIDFERQRHGK